MSSVCRSVSVQNASPQQNRRKLWNKKNPNSNACCRCIVDDVGDVRRAPQGVILAVLSQFLKSLRDKKRRKVWRLTDQKPWYCCCCCCPCSFSLSLVVAENRQIVGVFAFFETLGAKNTVKDRCFLCLGSPKPRYLRCFLPLVAKTTVFTVFFGQHLAKTLVFTHFSACCKNYFFHAKGHKNTVNYSVLDLLLGFVKGLRGGT